MNITDDSSRGYPLVRRYIPHRHKKYGPPLADPYMHNLRMAYIVAEKEWKRLMEGKIYEDVELKGKRNGSV